MSLVLAGLALGPGAGRTMAQNINAYDVPEIPEFNVPIPLGHDRMNTGGFYTAFEFMYLRPNRAIGDQLIAVHGLIDTNGGLTGNPVLLFHNLIQTGVPGTFVGSKQPALSTSDFQEVSFQPGCRTTVGYKFDSGIALSLSWLHLFEFKQIAEASGVAPFFNNRPDLADSVLFAPVFNFPADFAGPRLKTSADITAMQFFDSLPFPTPGPTPRGGTTEPRFNEPIGFVAFGIWNGANNMEISFTQRYDQWDLLARIPVWETEYARTYGLAGGRFAWFFDRFWWRTQSIGFSTNPVARSTNQGDDPGNNPDSVQFFTVSHPTDVATYVNTLSQRMYGPELGCGYEIFLGKGFSLSTELTGSLMVDIIKERAKYELGDESVQNKRSRNELNFVPNINASFDVWWYPIRGIQMRFGYNFMGYFNVKEMTRPVGFNYGAIEYRNDDRFRFLQGINAGVGFIF
jgi:hypothetical protein